MASDLLRFNSKNKARLMIIIIIISFVLSITGCISAETYTVTYAPGTHGTFSDQVTSNISNGTATPRPPTVFGEPGYVFNGWSPSVKNVVTENITYTAQWIKEPPYVMTTSSNIRTEIAGLHYYTYVDTSIHNSGGEGTAIVWVTVSQGSKNWTKSQNVYLPARGSKDITFTFIEPSFWSDSSIRYRVWVENLS